MCISKRHTLRFTEISNSAPVKVYSVKVHKMQKNTTMENEQDASCSRGQDCAVVAQSCGWLLLRPLGPGIHELVHSTCLTF